MSQNITCVFPGTFDPITRGHEAMIRRASRLFSTVLVAVATAYHKKTLFTLEERMDLAAESLRAIPSARVLPLEGLVTEFARSHGAGVLVRGVRSVSDFDYESQLAGMNRSLVPDLETLFLIPDRDLLYVSSTLVREIGMLGGDVSPWVAPTVLQRLMQKRAQNG